MADFSIQDAAFAGFGVVRNRPGNLPIWAGLSLIVTSVVVVTLIAVAGPTVMTLQSLDISAGRDPTTVVPLLSRLAPLYFLLIPISLIFYGLMCSAMNRAVLRPEDDRFGYLAIGRDEFRQVALLFLLFLLFTAIYLLLIVILSLIGGVLSVVAHAQPLLVAFVAVGLALAVMTWLAVRLSLASALTFERGRLTLFASWSLTKGRFWPIFGVYVLVLALASVIAVLTWFVTLALVTLAMGGDVAKALAPPNLRSLHDYFTLPQSLQLVLGAGVSALMWPVVFAPPAAILRQIIETGGSHAIDRVTR